jgi:BlaI family penicillinase repressor
MKNLPHISDAEWEIMNLLWEKSPMAATDIIEKLPSSKNWNAKTVGTFLNRLVKKGALIYEHEGKRYLYSPKVTRNECVRAESKSFLQRVFSGKALPMLAHLAESTDLTKEDIENFKKILAKKGK